MKKLRFLFPVIIAFIITLGVSNKVFAENVLSGATCYKTWYINVNQPIDPTTVTSKNVRVTDEYNNPVNVSVDVYNSTSIRISPGPGGYKPGETYRINMSTGIKSIYGQDLNLGQFVSNIFMVASDSTVNISDSTINHAIRNALQKPTQQLYQSDLDRISELYVSNNYGNTSINYSDISKLHNLNKLTMYNSSFSNSSSLYSLATYLSGIRSFYELDLSQNSIGSNISNVLDAFSNLYITKLNLSKTNISDISHIYKLKYLDQLDLSNNAISNITPLASLNLRKLDLSNNQLTNIFNLSSLIGLTDLDLSNNNISNLYPLQPLFNLQTLDLSNNNKKASDYDISSLSGLVNLQTLNLSQDHIKDIAPLENLDKMSELNLSSNDIEDIKPLQNMVQLKDLNLASNYQISDITSIGNMANLETLDLTQNNVSYLYPLKDLTTLTKLYLGYNNIVDLTPLEDLVNLQELKLNDNKITDVYPLMGLVDLNTLYLNDNGKINKAPLQNLSNLIHTDFSL